MAATKAGAIKACDLAEWRESSSEGPDATLPGGGLMSAAVATRVL